MCVEITKRIWKLDLNAHSPLVKFVLIKLGDHANEYGVCWPSVGLIADETGISERAVQAALKTLEGLGYIARRFRGRRSTIYSLVIPGMSLFETAVAESVAVTPQTAQSYPAADSPRTTIEPSYNLPYPPQSGGNAFEKKLMKNRRAFGTNMRARGESPCQLGINPRQFGTSPRQQREAERDYRSIWMGIDWAPRLRSFFGKGIWVSEWGDPPGTKQCPIPQEIINIYGAMQNVGAVQC